MSVKAAVNVEEYLATAYEFDPEYVDGELMARPVPGIPHGFTQDCIVTGFRSQPSARLFTASQVRLSVNESRYRVPDIMIFADQVPRTRYPSHPPFGVIEILSPEDAQSQVIDKFDEYAALGILYIWLVDPSRRRIYRYEHGSLIQQDALTVAERGFRLEPSSIFG